MGKNKGHGSTKTHGGARSASIGKGQGRASDSGDSIQGETLRMIQELGIPEAAAAAMEQIESSLSPAVASSGKRQKPKKNKKNKEASATEGASRNVPPKHVNGTAPERNPVQGGDRSGDVKNVSSAAATAPGRGGQGRGRDRGQDRGAAHASNERSSLRPSEDSDVRGRSQSGRGRDSSSPRRGGGRGEVRGRGQGVGRGGGGSGGGGWGTGRGREEESDLGPFAEIKLKLKHPVAESEGNWYDDVPTSIKMGGKRAKKAGGKGVSHNDNPFSPQMVAQARAAGKALHDAEVAAWAERRSKHATSDDKWVEQVLRSGTLSDKVAALTLQVQESPVHRIRVLDGLLDLGLKKERRTAQMALEALKDLFITNLLPDGRRLVPMDSRPLSQVFDVVREASSGGGDRGSGTSGGAGKAKAAGTALIMWYFEEQIRARFYRMLEAIEAGSRDTVENFKRFSLEAAKDLLEAKPEGEDRLLCLLVNKLGDPERKITSKVIYLLQTVLSKHPAMKGVMVREVQQYLHRPGLQPKAVYAGIIFLNQVYLKKDEDAKLASSLVQTYLRLFEAASSSSSLRDGGNVPKKKSAAGDGGKNASAFETPGTRLLSALLTGVNRARPYLPPGDPSVEGSVGSLFRVVHTEGFATATQALSLLFQIVTDSPDRQLQRPTDVAKRTAGGIKRPPKNALSGGETGKKATGDEAEGAEKIRARFYSALYAKLLSPDFGGASNPVLFLNLVYKAIKADGYGPRAAAFSKRLLQVCSVCDAPLAAAGLFVVSEALKKHPDLRRALFEGAKGNRDNASNGTTGDKGLDIPGYDSSKRDPRFSFSDSLQPLWEASLLRSHVHPSVSKFAEGLVSLPKHAVDYRGDPLADFALMPFLDRMAYRNPKARDPKQGDVRGMRRVKPAGVLGSDAPVNDESFVALPEGAVSADKVFFHKFFREKAERDRARGVVSKKKNASKSVEKDGRRRRRRRDGDGDGDDPTSEFMVDNVVDEKGGIGDMNFEGEEDSEEEAFAMQLAEGLMKDSGTADIDMDDEDPDMGGWSDMEDSDEDDVKGISSGKGAEVDLAPRSGGVIRGGDADDFMEEEEDSDSEPEDFEGDGSEGDSEAEEVQDMVALRKIADGMMNREGGEDEDSEGEADEVVGAKESGPSSSSNSRRVSWLRRGKMAPLYYEGEDDDDEEEDNDAEGESDSEEGYGAGPPREGVQEDDDEKGSDIPLEGEDGDSGTESDNSVGGGNRTQKHAAQSKQDRKGRPGDGETAFASFEDYEQILDAWDPENPDAPLPTEIVSALKQSQNQNQKASSFSKRGSGTGRGARGGSSGKRQKRR